MKKIVILVLVASVVLCGCSLLSGDGNQSGNTKNASEQDKSTVSQDTSDKSAVNTETKNPNANNNANIEIKKAAAEEYVSGDASVEVLVQLGEEFIDAAFAGDAQYLSGLCGESLADKIEKSPKLYIGTKTSYKVDKIDVTIKPLENSKYLLQTTVYALGKSDKIKSEFKYSLTVEKVKGDYYITDYKKGF